MNRREFFSVRKILPDDTLHELKFARARNTLFDKEIRDYKKELEENDKMDESLKMIMRCIVNMEERYVPETVVLSKDDVNECGDDSDSEEENDPRYELFLKHLKKHGKFYALEYEKDGVRVVDEYGEDTESDEECDSPEPRRKQKRSMKRKIVPSNQRGRTRSKVTNKVDKVENVRSSPKMVLDLHKEHNPQLGKKVNTTRKQKVGPSNQIPRVENLPSNALKMATCLTQSCGKLTNEVEVEKVKNSPDMVLISPGRKQNKAAKQKMGPPNQTSDIEYQRKHDPHSDSVKKINHLTVRKSTDEGDMVEKTKRNDMVLDLQDHHLQYVELEDDHYGYMHQDKEFHPEPSRQVNVAWKQTVGPSNQIPDVKKKSKVTFEVDKCLTKSNVTFEVDKVFNDKDWPSSMALDSHKERDSEPRRKLNQAAKQKTGPSNQVADVEKKRKYDQLSCSLKQTEGLTKRNITFQVHKVYSVGGTPNDMVLNSNKECNLQPRRKVGRPRKQNAGPSKQMPSVESQSDRQHNALKKNKRPTQRKLTDEVKDSPNNIVLDSEYLHLHENVELDGDNYGYRLKGKTVVNEKNHGLNDVGKEAEDEIGLNYGVNVDVEKERIDDSDSDVEILDSEAIIEKGILSAFVPSKKVHKRMEELRGSGEFRKQVLNVLSKPFDKDEYMRHQEAAKCYFDHHPELRRKLAKYRSNQGKRLTIYRGFFFWLQNLTREGSFEPWMDDECLAVKPGCPSL